VRKKGKRELDTSFIVPAPSQFRAAIAEAYLVRYGARRLLSLIQRYQSEGPWREKIEVRKKFKDKKGKYEWKIVTVSKYGHELAMLQKAQKGNIRLSENDEVRREELLNLTSFPHKSDAELETQLKDWIVRERSNQHLPEPLPDDAAEAYEMSFNPLVNPQTS